MLPPVLVTVVVAMPVTEEGLRGRARKLELAATLCRPARSGASPVLFLDHGLGARP
jgi:hypothetical protein